VALFAAGCATTTYTSAPMPRPSMPGTYHRVEKGQTLWKISKMYGAELEEIARVNRIPDTSSIETGQYIFIPSAYKKQATRYQATSSEDFIWPLKGKVVSAFGQSYKNMVNKGINIQPYGNLDVAASRGGKIVFYSENFGGYGKTIIIDHGDGFSTVYAGNAQVFAKPGESIQKGSTIAKAGSRTDAKSRSAYLHFEIRKKHLPQNPYYYLP
jgi:septal ring factor EnvC (AmiA/AmiB activator)